MRIRGKSHRERLLRARTLHSLKAIRAEQLKGRTPNAAIISAMKNLQKERFGVEGKPFLSMPEQKAMAILDKRVLPGFGTLIKRRAIKATRKIFDRKRYYTKYRLIGGLFGSGRLGLVMVKPELFARRKFVEQYLKRLGANVVFTKNFVFGKDDIQRLYPHTLADREKYHDFAVSASYLMTSPSMVIVFEHLPKVAYEERAKKRKIRGKMPQDVFNRLFKDRMREAISRKNLAELGFPKEGGQIKNLAKELDVYGFFEKKVPEGFDPLIVMNGIHVPDSVEVVRDARTLLNTPELELIKKRLK